jgi:oxygen-independent coproporphyrinogen-3 oxidase
MKLYENALDAGKLPVHRGLILSDDDVLRKAVIMDLMSNFKLDISKVEKEFGVDFFEYFDDAISDLDSFVKEGLVTIDKENKKITVSPTGTLLIRNISMPFDAYLKKIPESKRRFSKTV